MLEIGGKSQPITADHWSRDPKQYSHWVSGHEPERKSHSKQNAELN